MSTWQLFTDSPQKTQRLGCLLGEVAENGTVVLLKGDLGAGKTCFSQGVARGLEVPDDQPVTSPTFVIMNQYPGRITLYHFDLYRLSGSDDLETIGAEEVLGRDGVCLVEWPEQCDLQIPALSVDFSIVSGETRALEVRATDPQHRQLLLRWQQVWEVKGMLAFFLTTPVNPAIKCFFRLSAGIYGLIYPVNHHRINVAGSR